MYKADQGKTHIVDRREMVRVKIKSLAVEARQIRMEELRLSQHERRLNDKARAGGAVNPSQFPYGNQLREELYRHRLDTVRYESRHAHLAYGFIRGLRYEQMEASCSVSPNWDRVRQLIKKYGPANFVEPDCMSKPVKVKTYGPRTKRERPSNRSADAVAA